MLRNCGTVNPGLIMLGMNYNVTVMLDPGLNYATYVFVTVVQWTLG